MLLRYLIPVFAMGIPSWASVLASAPHVDFGYAFGTPHRLTVAPPDSGDKTLVDCEPGKVTLSWSYDTLMNFPVANFLGPQTQWKLVFQPVIDGRKAEHSTWSRLGGWMPGVKAEFADASVQTTFEVIGGQRGTLVRVTFANLDASVSHRASVECGVPGNWRGVMPAFVDSGLAENARDALIAGWMARADRVLVGAVGGDEYPLAANVLSPTVNLRPGESRVIWFVRPYRIYESMLPELRSRDWAAEFEEAKSVWGKLIGRASRVEIPDEGVRRAYYAGLADIFIMREPLPGDYIGTLAGTELYRSTNPVEPALAGICLDQAGLSMEAIDGYRIALDMQNFDGCWAESNGWTRTGWMVAGFKSWFVMEHFRMTRDRAFLENVYPRMLASSRWQERARQRTRQLVDGRKPVNYGLLPRGMGDAGLKNDGSFYGVFIPHNIWAVHADAMALEAAGVLGREAEAEELRVNLETARRDLIATIREGAIKEDGDEWIPGVAGKTSGSRWGALNAAFPTRLLAPDDPLIIGTIRKMETRMSPGGIPIHMGWMEDGLWVAISLDNLGETHLMRGNGDAAARYLYATLNHGTPLYSWCEERGPEPGSAKTLGDRQHLWTPVAVVRMIRDMLVFEDGATLHLGRGADRSWLGRGPVGGSEFHSHFGRINYSLKMGENGRVMGDVLLTEGRQPGVLRVHVRLPGGRKVESIDDPGARVLEDGEAIEWLAPKAKISFAATLSQGKSKLALPLPKEP